MFQSSKDTKYRKQVQYKLQKEKIFLVTGVVVLASATDAS